MMDQFVVYSSIAWHHYKGRQLFLKEDNGQHWFCNLLDK
jgi:hypothetical protein